MQSRLSKPVYSTIFGLGVVCMIVAGYFLIEGLSQFSGGGAANKVLIIGGILFQVTESVCFISAAALTHHTRLWRYTLFGFGVVLFGFSIAVMTLAQKTALQTGEATANANDEQRAHLRKQIESLDNVIASYRFNAEKQSKSIYPKSRALGQDSLNRASELEKEKRSLSDQLFSLNQNRKTTSKDFFDRLEEVTGLPALSTEFWFLVLRSLLIEMCGILMMSFGAHLRSVAEDSEAASKSGKQNIENLHHSADSYRSPSLRITQSDNDDDSAPKEAASGTSKVRRLFGRNHDRLKRD